MIYLFIDLRYIHANRKYVCACACACAHQYNATHSVYDWTVHLPLTQYGWLTRCEQITHTDDIFHVCTWKLCGKYFTVQNMKKKRFKMTCMASQQIISSIQSRAEQNIAKKNNV